MTEYTPGEPATWTWPDAYEETPMMTKDELLVALRAVVDQCRALARQHERERHGGGFCPQTRVDMGVHILRELTNDYAPRKVPHDG